VRSRLRESLSSARLSWSELRRFVDNPEHVDVTVGSGAPYQVETLALWEMRPDGDLCVIVAVDDGGWRAFSPLSESFVVSPSDT
jgi:hypothetical protein